MNAWALPFASAIVYLTQAAILGAGVVDDLRSRKFHNWLFIACCVVGLLVMLLAQGFSGLYLSVLGFAAGIVVLLPLVLLKMIGAGDMKLLAAFGIVAGWNTVVAVAVLSLFWGAAFGVVKTIASGQGRAFASNLLSIVLLRDRKSIEVHRMPYTVALVFGWLSHLVLTGVF